MDPSIAEQQLFDDTLYNDLPLPLMLGSGAAVASTGSELRLRAIALVEDSRSDEGEERGEGNPALHRLEAKLDLVLALCASLVAQQRPALRQMSVRWSARGLRVDWPVDATPVSQPTSITLQAADWLPDPISLPVVLLASQRIDGVTRLWLAFDTLGDGLQTALERHVFRLHRRQVASHRRQR